MAHTRSRRALSAAGAVALATLLAPSAALASDNWTIVGSPNTSASLNNYLYGVACPASDDCWSVGEYNNGANAQTLIEQNTGSGWSIVSSPNQGVGQDNALLGTTCASANDCWAVGYSTVSVDGIGLVDKTLIEQNTGGGWAIVTSPNNGEGSNFLYGVTCVGPNDCWAVGEYTPTGASGGTYDTLIEEDTGSGWSIVTSPNPTGSTDNELYGVACAGSGDCWTVGTYYPPGSNSAQTLTEQNTGSGWMVVGSPNTSSSASNLLQAVTCVSADQCWAVGEAGSLTSNGNVYKSLVEENVGSGWSIVDSPNPGNQIDRLLGVTCSAASDCWAAGYYASGSFAHTLIEHFDGTAWSAFGSPNTSSGEHNFLQAVTCGRSIDCVAVGYFTTTNGTAQTLVEESSPLGADVAEWPVGPLGGVGLSALAVMIRRRRSSRLPP